MSKMEQVDKLNKETEEYLVGIYERAGKGMNKAIKALDRRLLTLVSRLPVDSDGRMKSGAKALDLLQSLDEQLRLEFRNTYDKALVEQVAAFDDILSMIDEHFQMLGLPSVYTDEDALALDAVKTSVEQAMKSEGDKVGAQLLMQIKQAVLSGAAFSGLDAGLQTALAGLWAAYGNRRFYHDSVMDFYASNHYRKAQAAGLSHYLYAGNVIATTRPFCAARAGLVYTEDQVRSWEKLNWSGKREGDIFIVRGGYRCRHQLRAVRPEWLSEGGVKVQRWSGEDFKPPRKKAAATGVGSALGAILKDAEKASIDPRKIANYVLDSKSERGRNKARVFEEALGITLEHKEELESQLLENIKKYPATEKGDKGFGQQYEVIMPISGPKGKAIVITGWIEDEDGVRFVTARVAKDKVQKQYKHLLEEEE